MAADTGNGTTIAFGTSSFAGGGYVSIGGTEQTLDALDISTLATVTAKRYMQGDLYEPGEVDCDLYFDSSLALSLPALGTIENVTITFPVPSGLTNGATLAGKGFVKSRSYPVNKNNEIMMSKFKVQWTGRNTADSAIGPVFTQAS